MEGGARQQSRQPHPPGVGDSSARVLDFSRRDREAGACLRQTSQGRAIPTTIRFACGSWCGQLSASQLGAQSQPSTSSLTPLGEGPLKARAPDSGPDNGSTPRGANLCFTDGSGLHEWTLEMAGCLVWILPGLPLRQQRNLTPGIFGTFIHRAHVELWPQLWH